MQKHSGSVLKWNSTVIVCMEGVATAGETYQDLTVCSIMLGSRISTTQWSSSPERATLNSQITLNLNFNHINILNSVVGSCECETMLLGVNVKCSDLNREQSIQIIIIQQPSTSMYGMYTPFLIRIIHILLCYFDPKYRLVYVLEFIMWVSSADSIGRWLGLSK